MLYIFLKKWIHLTKKFNPQAFCWNDFKHMAGTERPPLLLNSLFYRPLPYILKIVGKSPKYGGILE